MLSLPLILGILAAILFVWFWQNSLGARERANRAAIEACNRMNLQFLDGTVAFARLGVARNEQGRINLRRIYIFDYTATSIERRQGFVVLLGMRIESIGFEPDAPLHRSPSRLPDHSTNQPSSTTPPGGNVLDLEAWRRRRLPRSPDERERSSGDNTPSDNSG